MMKNVSQIGILALLVIVFGLITMYDLRILYVYSGSMKPEISEGSLIVIKKVVNYSLGDVISYRSDYIGNKIFTHRIKDVRYIDGDKLYHTQGDENVYPDRYPVNKSQILGKVIMSVPNIGKFLVALTNPLVLTFLFYIPLGFLLGTTVGGFLISYSYDEESAHGDKKLRSLVFDRISKKNI